jgi:hypothetical protein
LCSRGYTYLLLWSSFQYYLARPINNSVVNKILPDSFCTCLCFDDQHSTFTCSAIVYTYILSLTKLQQIISSTSLYVIYLWFNETIVIHLIYFHVSTYIINHSLYQMERFYWFLDINHAYYLFIIITFMYNTHYKIDWFVKYIYHKKCNFKLNISYVE